MTYDIIVLKETSVFFRPHENDTPAFFNKNYKKGPFSKTCGFGARKCCFRRKAKTEKKSIRLRKHSGRCRSGQDLTASQ